MKKQEKQDFRKFKIAFAVVLIIVLLTSCVFTGSLLAWLKDRDTSSSGGDIEVGSVEFEIYNGSTKLTTIRNSSDEVVNLSTSSPLVVSGSTAIRNIDLKIRNTGTVSAIVRVTLNIYYAVSGGVKSTCLIAETPTTFNQINITNTGWVNDFASIPNAPIKVASGYSYYNGQIEPYTIRSRNADGDIVSTDKPGNAVPILTQILASSSATSTTYYVEVSVEGVAYAGNIYKEEYDRDGDRDYDIPTDGVGVYPFGPKENLPIDWTGWQ